MLTQEQIDEVCQTLQAEKDLIGGWDVESENKKIVRAVRRVLEAKLKVCANTEEF